MSGTLDMRLIVAIASLLLVMAPAALGQHSHRPQSTTAPAGAAPTAPNDPELATMTRAAAIQARPDQVGYFHSAIDSTDAALQ